jgi:hypothetical protein
MSRNEPNDTAAGIPLEAHVAELRRRREAAARLYDGSTYFREECEIFKQYTREKNCYLEHPPEVINRAPDDEGNEHQVWFDETTASFVKATWPDFFGLLVMQRPHEDDQASPIDYLERWQLHNELFGDAIMFLGVLETADGMRLLIRQPAIAGEPATVEQIKDFFTQNGWSCFTAGSEIAFFDPIHLVAISDTHRGNLILMEDGLLAPIDLRVQPLHGVLLEQVQMLCQKAPNTSS